MDIPPEAFIVVGDFNRHSTCCGYEETDRRGEEVDDWLVESRTTKNIQLSFTQADGISHLFLILPLPLTIFPRKQPEK